MEIWKPIENYPDYLISNYGNIQSLKYGNQKPCKPSKNTKGYDVITLCQNGVQKKFSVSRLVALAFISNPDNKSQVDHINRNKNDNRVENLRWVDNLENNQNKKTKKGKSGYRNIILRNGKYTFQVKSAHICKTYGTLEEALRARCEFYEKNNMPIIE